jgi:hypothetical protein
MHLWQQKEGATLWSRRQIAQIQESITQGQIVTHMEFLSENLLAPI